MSVAKIRRRPISAALRAGLNAYLPMVCLLSFLLFPSLGVSQTTYTIGGLFPLNGRLSMGGRQCAAGAQLAIDSIANNTPFAESGINDSTLSPLWGFHLPSKNFNMVLTFNDTGSNEISAIRTTLFHITGQWSDPSSGPLSGPKAVAILGEASSAVTQAAALAAGVYGVPIISYAATSPTLTDRDRYPSFVRAPPSDAVEARALVGLIRSIGWQQVAVISSADAYGAGFAFEFLSAATEVGVKVQIATTFPPEDGLAGSELITSSLNNIRHHDSKPLIIVLIAVSPDAQFVLLKAHALGMAGPDSDFTWLSVDGWSDPTFLLSREFMDAEQVATVAKAAIGSVGLRPVVPPGPVFDWFHSKWRSRQADFPALFGGTASDYEDISVFAAFTFDAVWTLGHALHTMVLGGSDPTDHASFLRTIVQTEFPGLTGPVAFSAGGDRVPVFEVVNLGPPTNASDLVTPRTVGIWIPPVNNLSASTGTVSITESIFWPYGFGDVPNDRPSSTNSIISSPFFIAGILVLVLLLLAFLLLGRYCWRVSNLEEEVGLLINRLSERDLKKNGGAMASRDMELLLQSPMERMIKEAGTVRKQLSSWSSCIATGCCCFREERRILDQLIQQLSTIDTGNIHLPDTLMDTIMSGKLDNAMDESRKRWLLQELIGGQSYTGILLPDGDHGDKKDDDHDTSGSDTDADENDHKNKLRLRRRGDRRTNSVVAVPERTSTGGPLKRRGSDASRNLRDVAIDIHRDPRAAVLLGDDLQTLPQHERARTADIAGGAAAAAAVMAAEMQDDDGPPVTERAHTEGFVPNRNSTFRPVVTTGTGRSSGNGDKGPLTVHTNQGKQIFWKRTDYSPQQPNSAGDADKKSSEGGNVSPRSTSFFSQNSLAGDLAAPAMGGRLRHPIRVASAGDLKRIAEEQDSVHTGSDSPSPAASRAPSARLFLRTNTDPRMQKSVLKARQKEKEQRLLANGGRGGATTKARRPPLVRTDSTSVVSRNSSDALFREAAQSNENVIQDRQHPNSLAALGQLGASTVSLVAHSVSLSMSPYHMENEQARAKRSAADRDQRKDSKDAYRHSASGPGTRDVSHTDHESSVRDLSNGSRSPVQPVVEQPFQPSQSSGTLSTSNSKEKELARVNTRTSEFSDFSVGPMRTETNASSVAGVVYGHGLSPVETPVQPYSEAFGNGVMSSDNRDASETQTSSMDAVSVARGSTDTTLSMGKYQHNVSTPTRHHHAASEPSIAFTIAITRAGSAGKDKEGVERASTMPSTDTLSVHRPSTVFEGDSERDSAENDREASKLSLSGNAHTPLIHSAREKDRNESGDDNKDEEIARRASWSQSVSGAGLLGATSRSQQEDKPISDPNLVSAADADGAHPGSPVITASASERQMSFPTSVDHTASGDSAIAKDANSFPPIMPITGKEIAPRSGTDGSIPIPTAKEREAREKEQRAVMIRNFRKKQSLIFLDLGLAKLTSWDFDIFQFAKSCDRPGAASKPLAAIGFTLLHQFHLVGRLKLDPIATFNCLDAIEAGYHMENPFHNALHGADVAQSVTVFLLETGLAYQMGSHEILAVLIASLIHDYDHPGVNNAFLINARHPLAMIYNDISVLESHHVAAALTALQKPGCDIFANLEAKKRRAVRSLIISLTLATDLKVHFEIVNDFKRRALALEAQNAAARNQDEDKESSAGSHSSGDSAGNMSSKLRGMRVRRNTLNFLRRDDKKRGRSAHAIQRMDAESMLVTLKMAIKCADLGHPAKPWALHEEWSGRLRDENFIQGDKEKELGLEVSPFMDRVRDADSFAKNQIGFFDFLVAPMWEIWTRHFSMLDFCRDNLNQNKAIWQKRIADQNSAENEIPKDRLPRKNTTPRTPDPKGSTGSSPSGSTAPPPIAQKSPLMKLRVPVPIVSRQQTVPISSLLHQNSSPQSTGRALSGSPNLHPRSPGSLPPSVARAETEVKDYSDHVEDRKFSNSKHPGLIPQLSWPHAVPPASPQLGANSLSARQAANGGNSSFTYSPNLTGGLLRGESEKHVSRNGSSSVAASPSAENARVLFTRNLSLPVRDQVRAAEAKERAGRSRSPPDLQLPPADAAASLSTAPTAARSVSASVTMGRSSLTVVAENCRSPAQDDEASGDATAGSVVPHSASPGISGSGGPVPSEQPSDSQPSPADAPTAEAMRTTSTATINTVVDGSVSSLPLLVHKEPEEGDSRSVSADDLTIIDHTV